MIPRVYVYCGPTITPSQVTAIMPAAVPRPPVRHGDLLALGARAGDIVVIIDGLFHQAAAVRHKEILHLLDEDVTVIGAASMGALRAAELHPYGMIGAGAIFAAYRDGQLTADDEVAVTVAGDGHTAVTEAMVDVRDILAQAGHAGVLDRAEVLALTSRAQAIHYTARTWRAITAAAHTDLADAVTRLRRWQQSDPRYLLSAKLRDAHEALRVAAAPTAPSPAMLSWRASRWDNRYLDSWIAQFPGHQVDGQHVAFSDVLAYQQLYDAGFPARWRAHTLTWISGCPGSDAEACATADAEAGGISVSFLRQKQAGYWLTPAELASLDTREQMLRILIRSIASDLTATVRPVSAGQAGALIAAGTGQVVAASFRCNAEIAGTGLDRGVAFLRTDLIEDHLAEVWQTSSGDRTELTAAARDRGFADLAAAADAARPFFLHAIGATSAGLPDGSRDGYRPDRATAVTVPQ